MISHARSVQSARMELYALLRDWMHDGIWKHGGWEKHHLVRWLLYEKCCLAVLFAVQRCGSLRGLFDTKRSDKKQSPASVHTWHMSKPVITFALSAAQSTASVHILDTGPNLWLCSCSKCYAIDCFGTYFTHVQTSDNAPATLYNQILSINTHMFNTVLLRTTTYYYTVVSQVATQLNQPARQPSHQ